VARARSGLGPSLIEARTWRWRGHWAGDDEGYRDPTLEPHDVEDPLDLYAHRLMERGLADLERLQAIHAEVEAQVSAAMTRAMAQPDTGAAELGLDDVYAACPH
jgi:pyruvate dehydrogenase E1 component alpha subunit